MADYKLDQSDFQTTELKSLSLYSLGDDILIKLLRHYIPFEDKVYTLSLMPEFSSLLTCRAAWLNSSNSLFFKFVDVAKVMKAGWYFHNRNWLKRFYIQINDQNSEIIIHLYDFEEYNLYYKADDTRDILVPLVIFLNFFKEEMISFFWGDEKDYPIYYKEERFLRNKRYNYIVHNRKSNKVMFNSYELYKTKMIENENKDLKFYFKDEKKLIVPYWHEALYENEYYPLPIDFIKTHQNKNVFKYGKITMKLRTEDEVYVTAKFNSETFLDQSYIDKFENMFMFVFFKNFYP